MPTLRRDSPLIIPRFIRRWFRKPYDGLRRFRAVEDGRFYRCGQPRPDELLQLIDKHGLKTVIALRGSRDSEDSDAWESEERAACESRGVRFVTLPCNHKNPPTREQVAEFLSIVRDEKQMPALVHCRIGQQRTGMFCALYRVHVQGVSPDDALREMDDLGFDSGHRRHQRLLETYERFAREEFRA